MNILIRKIERKGKTVVFKPNSKSGYKFSSDEAQPRLTSFQKACVQTKPQKDRRLGSFWTPNFCYIGMLIVQNGEANLADMTNANSDMKGFNNHFPDKKHYWYDKAKPQNPAMETYFIGVRATASILGHYHNLQKLGEIKKASILYKKYLTPLGLAKLLADTDSSLLSEEDLIYSINLSSKGCVIQTNRDLYFNIESKPLESNNTITVENKTSNNGVVERKSKDIKNQNQDESTYNDDVFSGIKPPKVRIRSLSELSDTDIHGKPTDNENQEKKNRPKLPNIKGEK